MVNYIGKGRHHIGVQGYPGRIVGGYRSNGQFWGFPAHVQQIVNIRDGLVQRGEILVPLIFQIRVQHDGAVESGPGKGDALPFRLQIFPGRGILHPHVNLPHIAAHVVQNSGFHPAHAAVWRVVVGLGNDFPILQGVAQKFCLHRGNKVVVFVCDGSAVEFRHHLGGTVVRILDYRVGADSGVNPHGLAHHFSGAQHLQLRAVLLDLYGVRAKARISYANPCHLLIPPSIFLLSSRPRFSSVLPRFCGISLPPG